YSISQEASRAISSNFTDKRASTNPTAYCGIFSATISTSIINIDTITLYMSQEQTRPDASLAAAPASGLFLKRGVWVAFLRVAIIGGFLLSWEIASGNWIEPFLISSPSRILASMIAGFRSGDFIQHSWVTLQQIAIGFPAGVILGIALGYAFGR